MNRTSLLFAPAGLLALNAGLVQVHAAQVDFFLKLDGITGESTDSDHKGWIQLDSFSFGVSRATTIGSSTTGAGAGKVTFKDIVVTKRTDSTSPELFQHCANGMHIKGAILEVVSHELKIDYKEAPPVVLEYTLTDATVTSLTQGGGTGGTPTDSLSLNFTRIEVSDPSAPKNTLNTVDTGPIDVLDDTLN